MPTTYTIPQLTAVGTAQATDLLEIAQGGISYKATAAQIVAAAAGVGPTGSYRFG